MNPKTKSIAIVLFALFLMLGLGQVKVFAAADNSKISITVTEKSGKDLEDHQVLVRLSEDNFSFTIDKEDISFSDEKGTKLNYWIELWDNELKEAKVWVKIPLLKANQTETIYLDQKGYGRSDGIDTFDFFDDFDDGDWTNDPVWTRENTCTFNGGDVEVANDFPQTKALRMNRVSSGCGAGITAPFNKGYGIWHALIKKTAGDDGNGVHFYLGYNSNEDFYALDVNSNGVKLFGPSWKQIGSTYSQRMGDWHAYDISRDPSGNWTVFIDGVARITGKDNTTKTNSKIGIRTISWEGSTTDYADNIYFRKYSSPEPEVSIGDDLSLSSSSLSVTKDQDNYSIKGTAFSSFKEDLKNIDVAVYDKDPLKSDNPQELARFKIDTVQSLKETDFETSFKLTSTPKELYLYIDPDHTLNESNQADNIAFTDKIKGQNTLETVSPLLKNILVFLALALIIFLIYKFLSVTKNSSPSSPRSPIQTKTCLKCGMSVDQMQAKCPVCGSVMFK